MAVTVNSLWKLDARLEGCKLAIGGPNSTKWTGLAKDYFAMLLYCYQGCLQGSELERDGIMLIILFYQRVTGRRSRRSTTVQIGRGEYFELKRYITFKYDIHAADTR